MGQYWSSRAAENLTYERRRRKSASTLEITKGAARIDAGHNHLYGKDLPVRRRDGRAVSDSTTPKTHQSDRKQTPSRSSHRHAITNSTARVTEEERSIPDRRRSRKEALKKPESNRIKSKRAEGSKAKHKSVSRKDSHQNQRERHQSENKQRKECIVCTDTLSLHHFHDRPPTKDCKHGADACRKCLRTWIETEFSNKMWDDIKCPICSMPMENADMREFAPRETFKRYAELYDRAKKEAQPGFTWCNLKGCKAGQVHLPHTPKFRCSTCEKTSCVVHNVKWHKGETCSEYDYRTNARLKAEEEEASKKMLEATTKQCPGCKRPIEKNMGCDHMECTKCRVHFCWACLLPYHSGVPLRARDAGGGKYCECYLTRA